MVSRRREAPSSVFVGTGYVELSGAAALLYFCSPIQWTSLFSPELTIHLDVSRGRTYVGNHLTRRP